MRAAKLAAKSATVAEMSPTAIYATSRAPPEVQREIEQLLDQGTTVLARQVGDMVMKHRDEPKAEIVEAETFADRSFSERVDGTTVIAARERSNHRSKQTAERLVAGNEFFARMREFFTDEDNRQLNNFWEKAGAPFIKNLLDGKHPPI